jgi:gamma-butyrobetaine dioxygenase
MNGEMVYFNYCWLRDNCVISWDSSRQEPTFDILDESDDLHATSARLGNESLDIIWSDGFESRYDLRWLERWHKGCNHGDLAVRVRVRENWYGDHYSDMARFNYDNVMLNPPNVADWAEAMLDEGSALIQYMPNSDKGLKTLCELFGTLRPSFSGYTFDVKSKANPENLAYTNKALELHTALPAEELAPGI